MMKSFAIVSITLTLCANSARAQSDTREQIIGKIESTYTQTTLFSPSSPLVNILLTPAKLANPGVSDVVWADVSKEAAPALSNVMTEKGGLLDSFVRSAVAPLSDADLKKLAALLADPVYLRFQAALSAPSTQRQLMQALMGNTLKMALALNDILMMHGLKEVH